MLPPSFSMLQVDVRNIIVETVKQSEAGEEAIIRLYEAHGVDQEARLDFGPPVKEASLTNLLEEELTALPVRENALTLRFGPFEILTIRVAFGGMGQNP
jgi:alpha-mannosidase